MKIIRLQIKYFIRRHIFINELHYIRERDRESERETSECQPLRLRRDETTEEEGGELDNMGKMGRVPVWGMPHIRYCNIYILKKKERHKGEEWGEMKEEVQETIGEGHRWREAPG